MPNNGSHRHKLARWFVASALPLRHVSTVVAITLSAFMWLGSYGPAHQTDQTIVHCKLAIAERFSVSSENQARFGALSRNPADEPTLVFIDFKTGRALQMGVFQGRSSSIALKSKDHRLSLSAPVSGAFAIRLGNSIRKSELEMLVDSGDAPHFNMTDGTGKKISFSATGSKNEPAIISLFDKTETSRVQLFGSPAGTLLSLFDKDGHVRMLGGVMPGKSPVLMLYDSMRVPSVEVSTDADGVPLLKLRDPHLRISNTFK